ncbi:CBASS cGAMP synthase [Agitococcus lubricus]|uniref:Cyclic GMP-AMP synthase n=1 Tax=Agitococcus lubricus TaxID=1077255 RepID=A0A2T5ISI5_9GAMM|nr:hypothetical protein [Agitococcus lubricus]PTQ86788.1 hypothetical protein C8N29_1287 [Agitococcus lubricus]
MTIATQNCHRLFSNQDQGYWYKLRPTKDQAKGLRSCQEKIRDCLTAAFLSAYQQAPKFRVQGSWAYGTCNQPALPNQEMDLDYGAYLPSSVFSSEPSPEEAIAYFDVAKKALNELCKEEGWVLSDKKETCLRLYKVMPNAHIDVPLYAVPDDMFDSLIENHSIALDHIYKEATITAASRRFALESYGGEMLTENFRAKEIDLENIQMIHLAQKNGEWLPSDCEKVREWFLKKCAEHPGNGQQLKAIVRYLKGWRDQHWKEGGPTSILLMIITVQHYKYADSRDDQALFTVTQNLATSLKNEVYASIDEHEEKDFNSATPQQRLEYANKAKELHTYVEQSMLAETPNASVDYLRASFGQRLPNEPKLVITIDAPNDSMTAYQKVMSQPVQHAKEAAMLAPQIGG